MRYHTHTFKWLFAIIMVATSLASGSAGASAIEMNYQGRLLTAAGQPAPDGDYTLVFALYDSPTGGALLWEETQTVAVRDGLFSVLLGSVTPLDFSAIHTTTPGHKYIETLIAGEAPMTPRVKLATAPLSAVAKSVNGDILTSPGQLVILDTLTGDTAFLQKARHDVLMSSIRNMRAVAPTGDSATVTTSVDPQAASTKYIVVTFQDVIVSSMIADSSHSGLKLEQSDALGALNQVILSADSSGATNTMSSARKALCMWITETPSIQDSSKVTIITDSLQASVKGKKKHYDPDTPSFFDITARDDGSIFTLGSKPSLTADTNLVIIRSDTSGMSFAMKKKGDIKDSPEIIIQGNKDGAPSASFDILPGNTEGIALAADSGTGSGINVVTARKVVKFKAGAALATTAKRMSPQSATSAGGYVSLSGALEQFVGITVDSGEASLLIGDTLLDSTLLLRTKSGGNGEIILKRSARTGRAPSSAHLTPDTLIYLDTTFRRNMGRLVVDSNQVSFTLSQSGGGLPTSEISISDVDGDGDLDLVEGAGSKCGIGVTNPTNILTVEQGSATDPIADAWTTYSSRRWKKNIEPIQGALDKVRKLRGVEYDWKASGKHDIGLIAEEVGEVIPEVVVYEDNGVDATSVDYPRLVALLIQALKEQQTTIDAQQSQIDGLKQNLVSMQTLAAQVAEMQETLLRLTSADAKNVTRQYGMK